MDKYCLSHLSDGDLLRRLAALVAQDRATTAELIAHIAEVDERQLFLPKGYPCMYDYCVGELHLSHDAALKRIRVGRTARRFPAIFTALADGRLHLTAVVLLTRHLTAENAAELLAAAEHRSKGEIVQLLAERFPEPDLPTRLEAVAPQAPENGLVVPEPPNQSAPGGVGPSPVVPEPPTSPALPPRVVPLSAEHYALQVTIGRGTHDVLCYVQALLGHAVPTADLAEVFDRALKALAAQLEKQKFAATSRPRPQRSSADPRHIPAQVKRTVWERDGGQCSFVGEAGNRCPARSRLEFDHADPVARGGEATVEGIRLRCRAHNQYEAECVFGAGFMSDKRAEAAAARARAAEARAKTQAAEAEARSQAAAERSRAEAAEQDPERSVVPWLRQLKIRPDDARRAAAYCERIPDAPLEQRVKMALGYLAVSRARVVKPVGTGA
jgi:hypothetical protein